MGSAKLKNDKPVPKRRGWNPLTFIKDNVKEGYENFGKVKAEIANGVSDAKEQIMDSAYSQHPLLGSVVNITLGGANVVLTAATFSALGPAVPLLENLRDGKPVNMRELGVKLATGMTGLNQKQQLEMLPFILKATKSISHDLFRGKTDSEIKELETYGKLRLLTTNATHGRATDAKESADIHYLKVLNYLTNQKSLLSRKESHIEFQKAFYEKLNTMDSLKNVSQNNKFEIAEGLSDMVLANRSNYPAVRSLFSSEDAMKTFSDEFNREFKSDTIANNFPKESYGKLYENIQSVLTEHGLNSATKSGSSSQSLSLEPSTTLDTKSFYTKLFDGKEFTTSIGASSASYGGKVFFKVDFYNQSDRRITTLSFSEFLGDENVCNGVECGKCEILRKITNLNVSVLHSGEIDLYFNLEGVYDEYQTDELKVFGFMWTNKKTIFDGQNLKNAKLTLDHEKNNPTTV